MVKSKFTIKANLEFLIIIGYAILIPAFGLSFNDPKIDDQTKTKIALGMLLFGLVILYYVLIVLKNKMIKITVEDNRILVNRFAGLLKNEEYSFLDFDCSKIAQNFYWIGTFESLFLIKENNKRIVVSEFYQSNYSNLKEIINEKVACKGEISFNLADEIIDYLGVKNQDNL